MMRWRSGDDDEDEALLTSNDSLEDFSLHMGMLVPLSIVIPVIAVVDMMGGPRRSSRKPTWRPKKKLPLAQGRASFLKEDAQKKTSSSSSSSAFNITKRRQR